MHFEFIYSYIIILHFIYIFITFFMSTPNFDFVMTKPSSKEKLKLSVIYNL